MYIENYDFKEWMQKLFDKLDELCKDMRALRNADKVLPEDDNLLDNQDLCLLFKVSIKTWLLYTSIMGHAEGNDIKDIYTHLHDEDIVKEMRDKWVV